VSIPVGLGCFVSLNLHWQNATRCKRCFLARSCRSVICQMDAGSWIDVGPRSSGEMRASHFFAWASDVAWSRSQSVMQRMTRCINSFSSFSLDEFAPLTQGSPHGNRRDRIGRGPRVFVAGRRLQVGSRGTKIKASVLCSSSFKDVRPAEVKLCARTRQSARPAARPPTAVEASFRARSKSSSSSSSRPTTVTVWYAGTDPNPRL
jgi:hypothetical protein